MSSVAAQGQRGTAVFNRLREGVILAFLLFVGDAIGFPHLFLVGSGSVLKGVAIASTLILIASSGFLITTHPYPARIAAGVGAILALGVLIVRCCALIAPGILLAITVGIVYASAWVFVAAAFTSTTVFQIDHRNGMPASKQVVWFGIGLLGFLWLAITLFSSYGLMAVLWLVYVPSIPYFVWLSCTYISQGRQSANHYKLAKLALVLLVLGVIIIASGHTLNQAGAIVWTVQITILAFAVLTAFALDLSGLQIDRDNCSQNNWNQINYRFYILLLFFCYLQEFGDTVTISGRGLLGLND